MKMQINGSWVGGGATREIRSPYSGEVVDTVPEATPAEVDDALAAAAEGARAMARLPASERFRILTRAADLLAARVEDMARTISLEEGKPITESLGEAGRMPDLLRLCAFEGTQLRGETLPLDAQAGAAGKLGMTIRVPCGVVAAITPFNYPLLLVVHKIGPALSAGNSVILKPASLAPLSALKLAGIFLEAGLPGNVLQCLTGPGAAVGQQLCADQRVRKISFTGSSAVGRRLTEIAGIKRLSLELGSNCPAVVLRDADLAAAADAVSTGGYVNAGQVCISTQRVLVERQVYADYLDALRQRVQKIRVGPSLDKETRLSAMVSEAEAERVVEWIREAKAGGARVLTGGGRAGAVCEPAIVADVDPGMRIAREELFGPAVAVTPVSGLEEALAQCNASQYGLGAAVFTRDIGRAMRFAREAEYGNVMINWSTLWRADLMPYGGLKASGFGKEGPRYAVEEMTELKTIVIHGLDAT
jgi:glyceraldehyde-3-phosphate dehydrogenase (NADP+)